MYSSLPTIRHVGRRGSTGDLSVSVSLARDREGNTMSAATTAANTVRNDREAGRNENLNLDMLEVSFTGNLAVITR